MSSIVNHKEKLQWNSRRETMPLEKWLRNVKLFNVQWLLFNLFGIVRWQNVTIEKKASKILT